MDDHPENIMKKDSEYKTVWDWVGMCRECIGDSEERNVMFGLDCVLLIVAEAERLRVDNKDIMTLISSLYYPVVHLKSMSPGMRSLRNKVIKRLKEIYRHGE